MSHDTLCIICVPCHWFCVALPGAAAAAAATAATAAAAAAAAAVAGESSPGFVEFMYKHIIPACFLAPLRSTFDFGDAHSFLVSCLYLALLRVSVIEFICLGSR